MSKAALHGDHSLGFSDWPTQCVFESEWPVSFRLHTYTSQRTTGGELVRFQLESQGHQSLAELEFKFDYITTKL